MSKLIVAAAKNQNTPVQPNDIIVVTHEVVSKSEGNIINIDDIKEKANNFKPAYNFGGGGASCH